MIATTPQGRTQWLLEHLGKGSESLSGLMAVLPTPEDRTALQRIIGPCKWELQWTNTCREAIDAFRRTSPPIVICDRDLPDGDWRQLWDILAREPRPPMFIVTSRLAERARPRDLYDVINLFRHDEFHPAPAVIHDALSKKCAFKGIPFPTLASLTPLRDELEGDWGAMLNHQLPALPPVESFWSELPSLFAWLEEGRPQRVVAAYPLAAGDVVIRPPAGAISIPGLTSTAPIEVIRFAASNRLCVDLDYVDERGHRGTRVIEPYSLRRTQAGDIVLHALRVDGGGHRSYRVDRIVAARATTRTFTPSYAIELTPMGPISAPPAAYSPRVSAARSGSSAQRSGPTYVYECSYCGKRFEHSKRDTNLRAHKDKNGWPCSGRHGFWVDTKW